MRIRKATESDWPAIVQLTQRLGLDYPGMESDTIWIAEGGDAVIGSVILKKHPDFLELCSLGVEENFRRRGIARQLVEALLQEAEGEVYLATVIPGFFEKMGFQEAPVRPKGLVKSPEWCGDCPKERCRVMKRDSQ